MVHDTWTDENDRVVKIVRDSVTIEEREYDVMGNLHQVTDARGNITKHWYDGIDRRIATEYHWIVPDVPSYQNPCETFEYYPDGRILASTDADDHTTVYSYDALNRLVTKQYNDGSTTTYTYAGSGNRIAAITENGETVDYTYDGLHRVTAVGSSVHGYEVGYTYNSADQITAVVAGDGFNEIYNVEYTYNDDGSLSSIEDQINQGVFEFTYQLNGLRETLERPNRLTTSYNYDNLGRLERIIHEDSLGQILERFDYTYDVDTIDGTGNPVYKGLRTKRAMTSDIISGTTQHYAYNNQGWLTRAKYVDAASGTEAFTYDASGNRTNRTWTPSGGSPVSTNFTIAPYSDLVTQAGVSGTMDYTAGGNLIDDNWIGREYEWDQFNRVTMVKSATGTPLYGFEFGGTGERTIQNTYTGGLVSSTRAFLYDREDVIAEFSNDTFATVFRLYIHGPGIDEPLAILGSGGTGSFNEGYSYYLHDGLGSVTGVVDENGKLGAIDYSAFGETRLNTVKIENRYRYTSREFVETNLYYYRARHMRPDLGRFISMDPLRLIHGLNMFVYVVNDPLSWTDPWGLYSSAPLGVPNATPENYGPDPLATPAPRQPEPKSFDANGNRKGSGYDDQDWKCSSIFTIANPSRCHKQCCVEHDFCYMIFHCNATSWYYTWNGSQRSCWLCNRGVAACFVLASLNPKCHICAIFDNLPSGPGPGPIPGFGDGPQWN